MSAAARVGDASGMQQAALGPGARRRESWAVRLGLREAEAVVVQVGMPVPLRLPVGVALRPRQSVVPPPPPGAPARLTAETRLGPHPLPSSQGPGLREGGGVSPSTFPTLSTRRVEREGGGGGGRGSDK